MAALHISIAAEEVTRISGFPVTNALIATYVAMVILILLALYSRFVKTPGWLSMGMSLIWGFCEDALGKKAFLAFPIVMTLFLFIVTNNLLGLLPGVGSVTYNHVPLLRSPSADLSTTLALATVAFVTIQFVSLKSLGAKGFMHRFIHITKPATYPLGLLEILLEFAKILSFAFRLLGNIFAGEVLLAVMIFLVPFILPAPFYGLEIVVALLQGFIFALLTIIFTSTAMAAHD